MIYFTLSNFCFFNKVNNTIYELSRNKKSMLKDPNIMINAQSGSIPFQCWSGDINNNVSNGMFYNNILSLQQNNALNIRFNFANILLEDYDYYDNLGNVALQMFNETGASIEISSIPFMEFLQEKYPYYDFVFSKQADIINPFNKDVLDILTQQNNLQLIGLPDRMLFDLPLLKTLSKKNKLELTVDPLCPIDCKEYSNRMILEQQNQLKYSGTSVFYNCPKCYLNIIDFPIITIEQIQETYLPLGFNHFTFSTNYKMDELSQLIFYIRYFFKPEYWDELVKIGAQSLNGENANGEKN